MGIPTGGPQQGRNPSEGARPPGRPQGNQPPQQPRQRSAGLPQPQQPSPQRPGAQQPPRSEGQRSGGASPRQPQRPSSALPPQRPTAPRQQPPVPRQEALPLAPEEQFDDPFSFGNQDDDLFSDVPKGSYEDDPLANSGLNEDDPFEYVPEHTEEEETYEPEPVAAPTPPRAPAARPKRLQGATPAPAPAQAASEEYSEEFVDRENLKLKPFGAKPKKKAKVGDFDPRKNMEGQRKIYRGVFLTALVAIVGFGAYQTFVPPESLSASEVEDIAALANGDTGFPATRGEGYALSFMDSLLNVNPGPEATAQRTAALSYFYGASGDARAFDSALTAVGSISQQIVYGPVVLDSSPLTANAASYEIGVLLSTTDSQIAPESGSAGAEQIAESLRWVSFNVNVYYDEATNSFAIAPNSPTLLPAPAVVSQSALPAAEPLGTAVDDYPESVNATVIGFLSGYRESTKSNFDKILQYIGTDADETLRDGLGSRYQFATPDDPSNSIDIAVFQPVEGDLSELKVDLTVDWQIPTSDTSGVTFPSHYVLTLQSIGGSGNYTVTKFAPYYWTEAVGSE